MDNNFLVTFPSCSNKFPDFPDRVETLVGWWKFQDQKPRPVFFHEHPWKFCFFLAATLNSICSWKNVMTFYFYPYLPFKNAMKSVFCLIQFPTCKLTPFQMQLESVLNSLYQKQPSRGALRKMCCENMQAANLICRRTIMPKCNLLNSHFDMGVLLQICCIFSEHLFLRTPLDAWFCCIPKLPNKSFILCESKLNVIHYS